MLSLTAPRFPAQDMAGERLAGQQSKQKVFNNISKVHKELLPNFSRSVQESKIDSGVLTAAGNMI